MSVSDTITKAVQGRGPGVKRRTHCAIGGHVVEGSRFEAELRDLLHKRLRLVVLIALMPLTLYLPLSFIDGIPRSPSYHSMRGLHVVVLVLIAWLASVLWASSALRLCTLRKIELALFGSLAFFFAAMQVISFADGLPFHAASCAQETTQQVAVTQIVISSSGVRWFFLIVMYGVFVPNTWQRCAWIVGSAAFAPIVLTPLGAWWYDRLCPHTLIATANLAGMMATAFAIALFGSYRIQVLQREAFQAKQMGQYRLGRKLGAGGMGEVYLAEHLLLRRPCAIKLIRPDQTRDPAVMQRFEREVQSMATLTAPNTVEVFDYGQSDDGAFYYVMEYLPGMNLETLVNRFGPLPPERAVHFLRQVCRALREAHAIGLLHRDIKPSNIIACERGGVQDVAKLLDFGLVQDLGLGAESDRLTIKGTVLGSPPFMSPEQAAGKSEIDARVDLYALGGVGYFLLAGRPPFVRETAMEMLLAHAYEAPETIRSQRPEVPADVEAVILRCLAKKPGERYASADELEKALAACGVADEWGEEQARLWWKTVAIEAETASALPTTATPVAT